MSQRTLRIAGLILLLTTLVSRDFRQNRSELKNFLSQRLGRKQDQIAAIQHGQPFAKNAEPRSPAKIFVMAVIYNAAPESYVKFVSDSGNLRHLPFSPVPGYQEVQRSLAALCRAGLHRPITRAGRNASFGNFGMSLKWQCKDFQAVTSEDRVSPDVTKRT